MFKHLRKRLRKRLILGFTLTELAAVTALVGAVPTASYVRVKRKALQTECYNNLRQVGQLITMYQLENGHFPKAAFYPKDPVKGADSIRKILGGNKRLWICPSMPDKLAEKGLTFVYNDSLSGARSVRNASKKWVLIEVTCVSKKAPAPHPGGYNILFADGHVITSKVLPKKITDAQKAQIRQLEKQLELYCSHHRE